MAATGLFPFRGVKAHEFGKFQKIRDSAGVLESKAALAHARSRVDFGLWGLIRSSSSADQLEALAEAGAIGFKAYLGYAFNVEISLRRQEVDDEARDVRVFLHQLLEVLHQPLPIDGVALEPTPGLIVEPAARDPLHACVRDRQRLLGAGPSPVAEEKVQSQIARTQAAH